MTIHFGLSKAAFHAEYQEKQFLLMRGAARGAAFSMRDVDQILYATEPTAPFLKLHNGSVIPEEAYVEVYNDLGAPRRRIVQPRFHALLKAGATMILNRVDVRHALIRSLCLDVAKFVSQHTLANGYLAFGNDPSFGKHWDCHDVFAVQLHGRKRWQLYRPTFELPLATQTSKECKQDCPDEPVLDIVLETGDVLYIPRGWWHCATAIGEETFHVAIGVHPPFVLDYFTWLCSAKLPQILACRRSLSFEHDNLGAVRAAADDIGEALRSGVYLAEYMQLIGNSDRVAPPFDVSAGVAGYPAGSAPDSRFALNTVYPRAVADGASWIVNGAQTAVGEAERVVVEALNHGNYLSMAQIEQLFAQRPEESAKAVVHALLERGVVQMLPREA